MKNYLFDMKILDLFAGIGGFSLAAHWMGWETTAFVEWDKYCQKVLKKNFPNVPIYGDINKFDGTEYKGAVDIVCGGFPCQPFSTAGKRKGKEDDRYLWPEMLRVIREVKPTWVVGENVVGITSMGNGSVFDSILSDLEDKNYKVQSFIIPACSVQAPHQRDRVWIIAHSDDILHQTELGEGKVRKEDGRSKEENIGEREASFGQRIWIQSSKRGESHCYSSSERLERENRIQEPKRNSQRLRECGWWKPWPEVAAKLCRVGDGIPTGLDKTGGLSTKSKNQKAGKRHRIKALGNAVVPQVVYELFKAIEQYENLPT